MNKFKAFAILIALIFSNTSFSNFNKESLRFVDFFKYPFSNSYVGTLWGMGASASHSNGPIEASGKVEYKKIKLKENKDHLRVRLVLNSIVRRWPRRRNSDTPEFSYTPKPSPLVVFIPGAFTGLNTGSNLFFQKILVDKGYHVLTLPNTLSTDFLKAKPNYVVGNPYKESLTITKVMTLIRRHLIKRNLLKGEVHIAGLSHGAFIASITAAKDQERERPIINGTVTLFSPPNDYLKSQERLDKAAFETEDVLKSQSVLKVVTKLLLLFSKQRDDLITEDSKVKSKAIIAHTGFKKKLIESMTAMSLYLKNVIVPKKKGNEVAYEKWARSVGFIKFLKASTPKSYKSLMNGDTRVESWMNRYYKKSGKNQRILTSRDDFINHPTSWDTFPMDNVIVLPRGGHFGIRHTDWFKKFVHLTF